MDTAFRLLPEQASTMAPRVDGLFWFISGVSILFALGIGVAVIVFAIRYRRKTEDFYPEPIVVFAQLGEPGSGPFLALVVRVDPAAFRRLGLGLDRAPPRV